MPAPLIPPTDATLVRRLRGGDSHAFEPLILRYQSKAHAVARAQGARSTTVDDVVQEAFFQAFRSIARLEQPERFGPWFLSIVRNVTRKELRRTDRWLVTSELEEYGDEPTNTLESREVSERLQAEVCRLPDSVRESIYLYYYEGESTRRVARALGLTTSDVKNRLRRGRELLRRKLWRSLGASLRLAAPSAREQRISARRLSLLILSTFAVSSGTMSAASASCSPMQTVGVITLSSKKTAAGFTLCLLLIAAGYLGGSHSRPASLQEQIGIDPGETRTQETLRVPRVTPKTTPTMKATVDTKPPAPDKTREAASTHGSLVVTVLHAGRNETASEVGVLLRPRPQPSPSWKSYLVRTDDAGEAHFERLSPGEYTIGFDRAYPRGRWLRVEVPAGELTELRVRLPAGIRVEGEVVDRDGRPVPDAEILVSRDEFDGYSAAPMTTSDADGRFEFKGAEAGRYISARKDGYAPSRQVGLSADVGETSKIRLVLPRPGGSVSGQVVDVDGHAIRNARVWVGDLKLNHGGYDLRAAPVIVRTDDEGLYTATGVGVGTVPIAARAPGYAPTKDQLIVERGRETVFDITLERGVTIEGKVRTSDGDAVSGANVSVGEKLPFVAGTDPSLQKREAMLRVDIDLSG